MSAADGVSYHARERTRQEELREDRGLNIVAEGH